MNLAGREAQQLLIGVHHVLGILGKETDPDMIRLVGIGDGWSAVFAAVVHCEISRDAVNCDAWVQWREQARDLIRQTNAMTPQAGK